MSPRRRARPFQSRRHPGGRQPGSIIDVKVMMDPGLRHAGMTAQRSSGSLVSKRISTEYLRLVVIVFAVLLSACSKPKEAPRLEAFPVRVQVVSTGTIEDTLTLVGSLKARDEAMLYSRIPGKLQENLLREGQRVAKDQAVSLVMKDEVGVKYEPAPVPSTLSGVVARIYLDRGANVTLDTPIALVMDDRELIAKADVPERYAGRVTLGQDVRVQVDAYPDESFRGKVSRVSPAVDPMTRTAPIEVRLAEHAGKLRSGMFAKLILVQDRKSQVLIVPVSAFTEETPPSVFVVENNKALKKAVTVGLRTESWAEITSGLSAGASVITSTLFGIQDESPVEVTP